MLRKIESEVLREGALNFHPGLNVIVGDDNAETSIGKSMSLMLVDFAFGGEDYLTKCADAVEHLGDHEFVFSFEFSGISFRFRRSTLKGKAIEGIDQSGKVCESLTLQQYREWLANAYGVQDGYQTFRALVSPTSRIWGRDNYSVSEPLNGAGRKMQDCIDYLLKTFGLYDQIAQREKVLIGLQAKLDAEKGAEKYDLIPTVKDAEYKSVCARTEQLEEELASLKREVVTSRTDMSALMTSELLRLKDQRSLLVSEKDLMLNRKRRLEASRSGSSWISKSQLDRLYRFFPGVDIRRIEEIESFHKKISLILNDYYREELDRLNRAINDTAAAIAQIDVDVDSKMSVANGDNGLAERLIEVAVEIKKNERVKAAYEAHKRLQDQLKLSREDRDQSKLRFLQEIQGEIYSELLHLSEAIYGNERKPPTLSLSVGTYKFYHNDDTGTGRAYLSLILLDLALFKLTKVPFLVHDSLLFSNVANDVIEQLINIYSESSKQIFISIDEVPKYSQETQVAIGLAKVIGLSKDHVLFTKDWKRNAARQ